MTLLLSGGCKNGKTGLAQQLTLKLAGGGRRYYVATMIPFDAEDRGRIQLHIAGRAGMGFETLEQGRNLPACLERADSGGAFLVDSVTALLLNEMFPRSYDQPADPGAARRVIRDLTSFAGKVASAVFVSDYIYSDAARYDAFTEGYRRDLALIDRAMAGICDTVLELCAGNIIVHKGGLPL